MKKILILLTIILALPAFAGKAVLLSSLDTNRFVYFRLEHRFKKAFKESGLEVVIHRETSPSLLKEVINDPETEILIWVSHAGGVTNTGNGMGSNGIIADFYGNDVKNYFSTLSKNIKFLGIVGCSAKSIFDGFRERGHYENNPYLEILSYPIQVQLISGFKQAIEDALQNVNKPMFSYDETTPAMIDIKVHVDQTKAKLPVAKSWVEIGDRVLGTIDENSPEELVFQIPEVEWNLLKNKNIKFIKDLSDKASRELPRLEIDSQNGSWRLFQTKDGQPIGGNNKHLYLKN